MPYWRHFRYYRPRLGRGKPYHNYAVDAARGKAFAVNRETRVRVAKTLPCALMGIYDWCWLPMSGNGLSSSVIL